jgi:hypothetical protein
MVEAASPDTSLERSSSHSRRRNVRLRLGHRAPNHHEPIMALDPIASTGYR